MSRCRIQPSSKFLSVLLKRTKTTLSIDSKPVDNCQQSAIKPYESIPGPRSFPLIGASWLAINYQHPLDLQSYLIKNYGKISVLKNLVGMGDLVSVFDVKDIEMMYRNEGTWPLRLGFKSLAYYRNTMRPEIFGDIEGLLSSNNEPWADFRSKVNPILMQPRTAEQYITSINEVANEFIERTTEFMEQNPKGEMPTDFLDELHKWALESIGVIALDKRLGCIDKNPTEESHKMAMYMLEIFRMTFTLDFSPISPLCRKFNLPIWKKYVEYQDFFTNKTMDLIDEAIKKVENDPNYANKTESEKSAFEKLRTKGKILSVVMTQDMLAAGIDTTGKIAGSVLYHLAINKDKQEKLRQEINKVVPGSYEVIDKEALSGLQYVRGVIKETMRLTPVTSSGLRIMTKDVVLAGYHIPKGIAVITPHLYLSQSEDHYKNPKEFIPERWLRDDPQSELKTVSPFVSMPFGFGPRSCIGKRLASLELEVFIAKMVKNFDISWNYGPMKYGQDLLYGIKDPLKLQLKLIK